MDRGESREIACFRIQLRSSLMVWEPVGKVAEEVQREVGLTQLLEEAVQASYAMSANRKVSLPSQYQLLWR
jgi:hypothetical protein